MAAAIAVSNRADVVVACGGATATEMSDRPSLAVDQHDFLSTLSATLTTKPLVVAAIAPGVILTRPWSDRAAAVMLMFLGGQVQWHSACASSNAQLRAQLRAQLCVQLCIQLSF